MTEKDIDIVKASEVPRLVEVWEAAVRATHHFLSEADIEIFKPMVRDGLYGSLEMACIRDANGRVAGFIGVAGNKIEALFVHPLQRGTGIGRRLAEYAIRRWNVTEVDVNEQNAQAIGFYEKLGFRTQGRTAVDGLGKPFPLLHMRLVRTAMD
ncbi:GNAT family N-acetyltransferase [Noviherbaspirillum sp.]|uniref:GNAT family N-acetyltransferase n=1 Tax=Noviherbaspirillum sp. TaxID=1926288 RepID=UPI002FE09DDF